MLVMRQVSRAWCCMYLACCSVTSLTVLLTYDCMSVGETCGMRDFCVVVLGTYIRHGVCWTRRLVRGAKYFGRWPFCCERYRWDQWSRGGVSRREMGI